MEKTVIQPEAYDRVIMAGIDILNDFSPSGALPVAGGDQVVPPVNAAARWVRQNNGLVIQVKEAHPPVTSHFQDYGGPWPAHGVEHTWGAAFIDGLEVLAEDLVLKKGTKKDEDAYSGYMGMAEDGTAFEAYVQPAGKERVALIIGGLATDYCVKATVLDGLAQADQLASNKDRRNLGVFVLRDAVRAVDINPDDGDKAIAQMQAAGAVFVNSEDLINNRVITAAA